MEVKVIINLGEGDASIFTGLLEVLSKGQITSPINQEPSDPETKTEIVEETKSTKKSSKSKTSKKVDAEATSVEEVTEKEAVKEEVVVEEEETNHASLEDIRAIARSLADSNRQKEYKPILEKYGYAKVNLIEEKDYDAIYAEMSKLVGDDNA